MIKKSKNIYSVTVIVIAGLFGFNGCQQQQTVPEEKSQVTVTEQDHPEKINLLDLPGDTEIIPSEHPKSGDIKGKAVSLETENVSDDSTNTVVRDVPDEIDSLNSQAYRVQLFSSKVFGESRKAKQVAEEIFDRPVFMDYEVPYYKVRVGNFADREQAEEYQMRAKSAGYTNAWVVVVTVNIKETTPMYDDMDNPESIDSLYQDTDKNKKHDEPNDSGN